MNFNQIMISDQIMIYISSDDLQFHFGVDHPEKVNPASYQVIRIVNPLRPVRHHPQGHLLGKRSGEDTGDLTHNLQVKAFGKKYDDAFLYIFEIDVIISLHV